MISKKLEDALNEQINKEFYSAYLYLGMAAHFESEGLKGFAKWMRVQASEEQEHAMKIYDYLFSVDAKPVLKAVKEAPTKYEKSPVEVIQEVLKHEQYVTASINSLYANDRDILDAFKHISGNVGLLILDKALGERK